MFSIDRRLLTHANWLLLGFTMILFLVGVANLYSASGVRVEDGIIVQPFFQRQLIWGSVGALAMLLCTLMDYRHIKSYAWIIFFISIFLLAMVPIFGKTVSGAKRWLDFGFFSLQPSEVAKISVLLIGASLLSETKESLGWIKLFFISFIGLLPCFFILAQPDLGTSLNLMLLLGGMILFRGVKPYVLKVGIIATPLLLPLAWFGLRDYQKTRILTLLDPSKDPQGAGYHVVMSKTAIGSGQMWGKGFREGTQNLLRFLPEKHTDFAIAVFSEEWGFVGCTLLLALFCIFLLCIIYTAQEAKDRFGSILCAGVFFYFFWQILINIGMVVGIMPVVGIPLPFISYGGTSTLVNFIMLGLVMNVSMRRFMFKSH